jgi:DNA-binding transcriptional MerR regulator
MTQDSTTFLTTLAAARLAERSPETIRAWERTGRLPAVRTTSGQRLFREADVRAAVRNAMEGRREK